MTIHQLKDRCWELRPPLSGEDRQYHYDTEAKAKEALKEARENDEFTDPATAPRQLDARCWVVQCDGECGQHIDEEDEGYISHCETPALAGEFVTAWHWTMTGDLVYCDTDRPEGAELPPPSPAELEAAGQLRLPGIGGPG